MATTAGASSSETYDAITHFGLAMPGWVQSLVLAYTHYGLVLVAPFFAWLWWRARATGSPERMAAALLVPAATVVAYVLSEIIKAFVHEQRPCRGLPPEAIVGACPPPGDWSFPSNHSTIAAAVALGGAFAWRKGAPWLAAFAATMGFSRVFVGAHYPHDVLIGLALGAGMALLLQRYALGPAAGLVRRFSGKVPFGLLGTVADAPVSPEPPAAGPDGTTIRTAGSLPPRPVDRAADAPPAPPVRRARPEGQPARRGTPPEPRAAGDRPVRPAPDAPRPRAASTAPRRQNSQPIRTAAPQTRTAEAGRQNSQPIRTTAPRPDAPAPRRQNSQPITAAPQPRAADAPPPSPGRPPAQPPARSTAQPPARPARTQQPRPAGPPHGRAAGSPPPRPANQAQAGPPPEVSPGDRPSRRTPGASRPTPPGRRNAHRNA
ncbi:phosphatase PAP2 family protein [Amycolatopsis sp. VS8301801F10]|uniref:phosphatase PAP2 family protein n=1 Tax=Amycolatopsis sp. VS8301801F10 TaxID=2652442 RepID=UPI0038FC08FB